MMKVMMIIGHGNVLNEVLLFFSVSLSRSSIFISTLSKNNKKKRKEKTVHQKSRSRNTQGAIIDQKYNTKHVHDELIFTHTAASVCRSSEKSFIGRRQLKGKCRARKF